MIHRLGAVLLRKPEPSDVEALYAQKNDPEVASLIGGFSGKGYARADLVRWVEYHNGRADELVWAIEHIESGACIGHVGLYHIDHRVRSAEFAILLGDRAHWGKGIGRQCTAFAVRFGFDELNLNRIHLTVLETNERALGLYRSLGFVEEGRLRQAQFKGGTYLDVIQMGLLRSD